MSLVDKVLRGTKSKMVRTFVDEKEADRRYAICFGDNEFLPCESLEEKTGKCKECGCPMDKKVDYDTIATRKVTCPLKKW